MEMGGNFCQILELGGTTIKGWTVDKIYHTLPKSNDLFNIHYISKDLFPIVNKR